MVRADDVVVRRMLPCPRGGQGRKNWCARIVLWCAAGAARIVPWCARIVPWCTRFMPQQNAALPSRRAGQCFQTEVPRSNHGRNTRYLISLAFLAPK
ncbi:uncharacterized protein DS421_3g86640 [Arachis hypogaea]|nr:uncharacterized protein DS421_3g86640 [Arachis hypogaea]